MKLVSGFPVALAAEQRAMVGELIFDMVSFKSIDVDSEIRTFWR